MKEMFSCTFDISLMTNGEILLLGTEICEAEMMRLYNQFTKEWTIVQWEEKFPKMKENRTNHLVLSIYNNQLGDEHRVVKNRTWTWAKGSDYTSSDGWDASYEITKYPICFIEEFDDLAYGLLKDDQSVDWYAFHFLRKKPYDALELNLTFGSEIVTPFNRVATIKFDWKGEVNYGFECVNGLLNFKEMCKKHVTGEDEAHKYIPIHYNWMMGAWMEDQLRLSTLRKLIKDELKVGEDPCVKQLTGSMIIDDIRKTS